MPVVRLRYLKGFLFNTMEKKTISNETLERVKSLPRLDYLAFQMLVTQKRVKCLVKFKRPRTIFFDESQNCFFYLNPFHCELHRCGIFIEEMEVDNG